jgi:hypothetical protein
MEASRKGGSLDPLGALAHAERLFEVLLQGFTVRILRARLRVLLSLLATGPSSSWATAKICGSTLVSCLANI